MAKSMSKYYTIVSSYYKRGFYTEADVAKFVKANKITKEEYELITGIPYEE